MKPLEGTDVVLCADPVEVLAEVGEVLRRMGCRVEGVETPEQLRALLEYYPIDLIVAHVCGPTSRFLEFLSSTEQLSALPPIVAVACSEDYYLDAMRHGAFDYIALPLDENELARITTHALNLRKEQQALPR